MNSDFMSTTEAAQTLYVSRSTVHRLIADKEIEAVRIRKLWRVRTLSVYDYLRRNAA